MSTRAASLTSSSITSWDSWGLNLHTMQWTQLLINKIMITNCAERHAKDSKERLNAKKGINKNNRKNHHCCWRAFGATFMFLFHCRLAYKIMLNHMVQQKKSVCAKLIDCSVNLLFGTLWVSNRSETTAFGLRFSREYSEEDEMQHNLMTLWHFTVLFITQLNGNTDIKIYMYELMSYL